MAGVLRICAHTCDKAHLVALTVYIHIERIYRKLRHKLFSFVNDIEAAEHIGSLKHRKLRLLDFVILPACLGKVCLRHLKSITKQCIVLLRIILCQYSYLKFIRFKRMHSVLSRLSLLYTSDHPPS